MNKKCPDCGGALEEIESFLVRRDPKDQKMAIQVPMYVCPKCNHHYQEDEWGAIIRADE